MGGNTFNRNYCMFSHDLRRASGILHSTLVYVRLEDYFYTNFPYLESYKLIAYNHPWAFLSHNFLYLSHVGNDNSPLFSVWYLLRINKYIEQQQQKHKLITLQSFTKSVLLWSLFHFLIPTISMVILSFNQMHLMLK